MPTPDLAEASAGVIGDRDPAARRRATLFLRLKDHQEPTDPQKQAGNYAKRQVPWMGMTISVENEAGSIRRGVAADGENWSLRMFYAYGYLRRTMGVDGDQVDVYLGPLLDSASTVYIVHQNTYGDWKTYDEDKAMIGFPDEESAREAYLACYDDPRFLGPITAMPVEEFVAKAKATLRDPAMIKSMPAAGQRIEFLSDRFTDKGPATGTVEKVKATVDGYYIDVKFADGQGQFSWEDIRDRTSRGSGDLWLVKALQPVLVIYRP